MTYSRPRNGEIVKARNTSSAAIFGGVAPGRSQLRSEEILTDVEMLFMLVSRGKEENNSRFRVRQRHVNR